MEIIHVIFVKKDLPQNQVHLTQCETIIEHCPVLYNNINVEYEDIYGNPGNQLSILLSFIERFLKQEIGS